jgi:signal transduction histidine kinase
LSRTIEKNIEGNIYINGERLLLQLLINSLLDNALKYSPKERPVYLELNKAPKQNSIKDY